jgi:hypothetical protein
MFQPCIAAAPIVFHFTERPALPELGNVAECAAKTKEHAS